MIVHIALQEKRVAAKKEKPTLLEKFLQQSQSNTPEPEPKKAKIPFMS